MAEINIKQILQWVVMIVSAVIAIQNLIHLIQVILSIVKNSNRFGDNTSSLIAFSIVLLVAIAGFIGAYKYHLLLLLIAFVGSIVCTSLFYTGSAWDSAGVLTLYLIVVAILAFLVHKDGGRISTTI